ncbi:MAG: hypothetical protein H2060_08255 [Azoarcus sp.]|nr:hypothetical protein [Azoarcus sp.]
MNSWQKIWIEYHQAVSSGRIAIEALRAASALEKILVLSMTALFIFGLGVYYLNSGASLLMMMSAEIVLLIKIDAIKNRLVLEQYGDPCGLPVPDLGSSSRASRYLIFKQALQSAGVRSSDVMGCYDLVDMQIDIAQSGGHPRHKVLAFAGVLVAGISSVIWNQQTASDLTSVAFLVVLVSAGVFTVMSVFPTRLERFREMKYFMALYCREEA